MQVTLGIVRRLTGGMYSADRCVLRYTCVSWFSTTHIHVTLSTYMSEVTNVVVEDAVKDFVVFETYGCDFPCSRIREFHALEQVVRAQCNSRRNPAS